MKTRVKTIWSLILLSVSGLFLCSAGSLNEGNTGLLQNYEPGYSLTLDDAVAYNLTAFPEATLADLYKSFYQDMFGPGHILADTVAARNYFNRELSDTTVWGGPVIEPTGQGDNFVRVNMDLIRQGIIPADVYFNAFVNSLQKVKKPAPETWIAYWMLIDNIASSSGKQFANEKEDRELIERKLANHDFTIHHSAAYDSIYRFHYRIISIPAFKDYILPYLSK